MLLGLRNDFNASPIGATLSSLDGDVETLSVSRLQGSEMAVRKSTKMLREEVDSGRQQIQVESVEETKTDGA